jgi:RecA/RadA recombinase
VVLVIGSSLQVNAIPKMCNPIDKCATPVKLLVIDSLAGLLRFDYDTTSSEDMKQRTMMMFHISRKLKWIADTFQIAVVVVNQVCMMVRGYSLCEMD